MGGPAIEKLLHHAHENKELQEALKQLQPEKSTDKKAAKGKGEGDQAENDEKNTENSTATSGDVASFNPLVWLSDHLRQFAKEPSGKYRTQFEQRVAELARRQQEEEQEAAASKVEAAPPLEKSETTDATMDKIPEE